MTLKTLLKNWISKSKLKDFISEHNISDIIVYGSVVRGKDSYNDLDVAIILNKKIKLEKRLKISQKFRNQFPFDNKKIDVKTISYKDLIDPSFIAKQAIIAEGYSLIDSKFIHQKYGFKTFVVFNYNLSNLSTSQKKMLYYALNGSRGNKGMLEQKKALDLGNTIIKVPLESSFEFKELFNYHNLKFKNWISVEYNL